MRETGYPDQITETLRIGIINHLTGKISSKLWNTIGAGISSQQFWRYSQSRSGIKNTQSSRIVKGNGLWIPMSQILQHFNNRRIIVAQNIQLYQTAADGMIIKMGGNGFRGQIICRMLQRCKEMHIHIARHYHDTRWMLACGTLYSLTACRHMANKGLPLGLSLFLVVFLHKTVGGLIRHCSNGAGSEYIVLAKKLLCVLMSHRLIFTREVQINIWYLISIKAQEHCKRNFVTILQHIGTTHRTFLIWQIIAAAIGAIQHKLAMLAIRTTPMRWQRIYLCNICHGSHKGGTYRTSGTYQITIYIGFPHQLMSNEIQHGEAMSNNWL